jgi:protein-disulfide isomerase
MPGFVGTPSFVINGKLYSGSFAVDELSKAIDAALQDVAAPSN